MKIKFLIIFASLILLAFVPAAYYISNEGRMSPYGNEVRRIRINESIIRAEIVSAEAKRKLGLSGREGICQKCGMLFVFDKEGAYSFWMKDMRFDIDILWIKDNSIVAIEKNVSHKEGTGRVINPKVLADKVLEINAGLSERLGIAVGDEISF